MLNESSLTTNNQQPTAILPVIAIVGRPNVGKSTLFNCLTKSRDAIVHDMPGVTRDRQYGQGKLGSKPYIVIDTAGLSRDEEGIEKAAVNQARQAVREANLVLFILDARDGLTPTDRVIASELRQLNKDIILVVNKIDGLNTDVVLGEFYSLGLGEPEAIAAAHGRGVTSLMEKICDEKLPASEELDITLYKGIKVAIVGRPNVGKSTLVNRILGEERVVVFDQPGTTRDSIFLPLQRHGKDYTIIDTAGVRRRGRIDETVEKFSVVKTLQAIEVANVVIMVLDARAGISDQDLSLLGFILDAGRALVLVVNKWDNLAEEVKEDVKREMDRRLAFVSFARCYFISALHGTGVGKLYGAVEEAYECAMRELPTSYLTDLLEQAIVEWQPPLVKGRRIKLRYAHTGGHNPPIIIIHGNQTDEVPGHYQRYLTNYFREHLKLVGTPLRILFKTGENPYKDKKNILTPRQIKKRKRAKKIFK